MTDLEKYLNERLQQFKVACKIMLEQNKKGLQGYLNQRMLEHIAYAEKKIEEGKEFYVQQFRRSMADLERRKRENKNPLMEKMYIRMEEQHKKMLEHGLQSTENLWKAHIEECRANIR